MVVWRGFHLGRKRTEPTPRSRGLVGHSAPKKQANVDQDILPHCKYHKGLKTELSGVPMKCRWSYCPKDGRHGSWTFLSGALVACILGGKVKGVQVGENFGKRNN